MVTQSGVNPTLAPPALPATDDLPRLAAHGLLELGWEALRRDEVPHPVLPPVEAGLILAHPSFGIALLDVGPARSAAAVARLRLRLAAVGFGSAFPGRLPIIHRSLVAEDLWRLSLVLDHAFAAEPPLGLAGRAWIGMVQQALLTPPSEAEMAAAEAWANPAPSDAVESDAPQPPDPSPEAERAPEAAKPSAAKTPPRRPQVSRALVQACAASILVLGAGAGVVQYLAQAGAPPAPAPAPADAALAEASGPPTPVAAESAPLRIVLHHAPSLRGEALALSESMRAVEAQVDFRVVDQAPGEPVVRYFHQADRPAAQRVARSLGPDWQLQDVTHMASGPSRGALEAWLPAASTPPPAQAAAPPENGTPAMPADAAHAPMALAQAAQAMPGQDAPRPEPLASGSAPPGPPAAAPPEAPIPEPDAARLAPLATDAAGPGTAIAEVTPDAPHLASPSADPGDMGPAATAATSPANGQPSPAAEADPPAMMAAAPESPVPEPDAPRLAPLGANSAGVRPAAIAATSPAEGQPSPAAEADPPAMAAATPEPPEPDASSLESPAIGPAPAETAATPPPGAEPRPVPEPDAARLESPATGPAPADTAATPPPDPLPQPDPRRPLAEPSPAVTDAPVVPPVAAPALPAPAAAPPSPALSPALVAALLARGNQMLEQGDISGARLLFGRAASAGSAAAATAMARTFDASVLAGLGARGIRPDAEQAAAWYRRAAELQPAR